MVLVKGLMKLGEPLLLSCNLSRTFGLIFKQHYLVCNSGGSMLGRIDHVPYYLFEDPGWRRFGPLTTIRPVWSLRVGSETLLERITHQFDLTPSGFHPRAYLIAQAIAHHQNRNTVPVLWAIIQSETDLSWVHESCGGFEYLQRQTRNC